MDFLVYAYSFVIGTIIGSLLGVVIDRLPKGESLVKSRSHCDHCKHKLAWYDLIPIVSFLLLGGRCRYCGKKLSLFYPLVEILTGLSFAIISLFVYGYSPLLFITDLRFFVALLYFFSIVASLIVIFFVDMKNGIIPFKVVSFAFILTILWHIVFPYLGFRPNELPFIALRLDYWMNYFYSAAGAFLFFLALFAGTKGRGIGFGDVTYVLFMGFLLGFPKIILGLYIAFIVGALVSVILIILGKKKLKKSSIPFGPFLVFGTVVSLFWGQALISQIILFLIKA